MELRQGTAVVIPFGPFVSPVDGVTLAVGAAAAMDNGTTGIMLSKNGGAKAVRHATVTTTTYDAYGDYLVTLDTTDTNTLGTLRVSFTGLASTYSPVWADFMVITANEWDSKYATAIRPANMTQILGTAVATPTVAGIPKVEVASKLSTVALSTQEKADVDTEALAQLVALGLDHMVATTIGAGKPVVGTLMDKIMNKDGTQTFNPTTDSLEAQIDNTATAAEVTNDVWDELLSGHVISGSAGAALTAAAAGGSLTAAAIADAVWDELLSGHVISGSAGSAQGKANTLTFTGANVNAQIKASDDIAFTATQLASLSSAADTAAAFLDHLLAGHAISGSVGEALTNAGSVSAATIAATVWNYLLTSMATVGSIGLKLRNWVLGADSKVLLSTDAQAGVTIPTVTTLTNDAGITQAGADKVWGSTTSLGATLLQNLRNMVWNTLTSGLATAGSIGKKLADWVLGADAKVLLSTDAQAGVTIPTVTNLTNAPGAGDFTATMKTSLDTKVATVWDALLSGHTIVGSSGAALAAAGGVGASPATIAAAVWDALLTGIVTSGSIGKKLKDWTLGTDFKALLSTDSQAGVVLPTVTAVGSVTGNVAGSVGSVTGLTPATIAAGVWDALLTGVLVVGSIGKKIKDWVLGADYKAVLSSDAHTGAVIPTVTNLTNAAGAGVFTSTMKTSLATQGAADLDIALAGHITAGTVGRAMSDAGGGASPATIATAVGDEIMEGGITLRQAMRVMLAVLAGKSSGMNTSAPIFRDTLDTKNRVSGTIDLNGNRTAVTLDVS
jgi:hypothetical protein